jgi:hypothetical protein
MLIRVATREVQVGMYVDSMEGAWIDNPFWRRSFLIKTDAELERLRSSAIQHVTIDTTKGRGVTVIPQAERRRQVEAPAVIEPLPVERRKRRSGPQPDDLTQTIDRSKEHVIAMFQEARLGRAIDLEAVTPVVDDISVALQRDRAAFVKVEYTYLHSIAV